MSTREDGRIVAVVGAGRGLGRAAATAFAGSGDTVLAVSRTESELTGPYGEGGAAHGTIRPLAMDATAPESAATVIDGHRPDTVVLVAGATPRMAPFDEQSWDDFSRNWETDVRLTHLWLGAVLRAPLRPGSRVIVISSGAALAGSPLSGGYAGAKAMQRLLSDYAQQESDRRNLALTFSAVLPRITPLTHIGAVASEAYARRQGISNAEYAAQLGEPLTPEAFGSSIVALARMPAVDARGSFLLATGGLQPLP